MTKRPFDEARPLTPRAAAQKREREIAKQLEDLLAATSEEEFRQEIFRLFDTVPGESRYEAALAIWKSSRS